MIISKQQYIFIQSGLPSTLIRHESEAFRKRSSNGRIWKCLRSVFMRKEKRSFSKKMASRWPCDFLDRVFLKHKSKMTGDCCLFKFLRRCVDGALLCAARKNYHTPHVVIELLVKILLVDLLVSIKGVPSMRITTTQISSAPQSN